MKIIFFFGLTVMFCLSVSAHDNTKSFQQQFGTSLVQNTTSNTSMYMINNGGLIQLIYKLFYKVGQTLHDSVNDSTEEETTTN